MPFVVMATSRTGTTSWLSAPSAGSFRTLTTREHADVFQTVTDAHTAIAELPQAFGVSGLTFSVRDGRPTAPLE
jgi:hypothetical protein